MPSVTAKGRPAVDYQRYLASREWAIKKREIRERSDGKCERCRAPQAATHHLTYERLGNERLTDLMAVCGPCHEFLSGLRDDDPAQQEFSPAEYVDWVCHLVRYYIRRGVVPDEAMVEAAVALSRATFAYSSMAIGR